MLSLDKEIKERLIATTTNLSTVAKVNFNATADLHHIQNWELANSCGTSLLPITGYERTFSEVQIVNQQRSHSKIHQIPSQPL
jgi:hypothetical protein